MSESGMRRPDDRPHCEIWPSNIGQFRFCDLGFAAFSARVPMVVLLGVVCGDFPGRKVLKVDPKRSGMLGLLGTVVLFKSLREAAHPDGVVLVVCDVVWGWGFFRCGCRARGAGSMHAE